MGKVERLDVAEWARKNEELAHRSFEKFKSEVANGEGRETEEDLL